MAPFDAAELTSIPAPMQNLIPAIFPAPAATWSAFMLSQRRSGGIEDVEGAIGGYRFDGGIRLDPVLVTSKTLAP